MQYSFIQKINKNVTVVHLLILFWSIFWLLNGLDKFFNQELFFGVTRDDTFIAYFATLGLDSEVALTFLYSCALCEIALGVGFLYAFKKAKNQYAIVQVCLKCGMLIFITFSAFDILFGDRQELWEHSTFLLLHVASVAFIPLVNANLDLKEDPYRV